MHPLHDYVAKQLAEKVKARQVVVWYDERGEFVPFVDELRGTHAAPGPAEVSLDGQTVAIAEYTGSMFELRAIAEPYVSGDVPAPLVIYLPGCARERRTSVLMELEKGGTTWEPQLRQLARNLLLQKFTLGDVDEILAAEASVSYEDLAQAARTDSGGPPSILKTIFRDIVDPDALLGAWIASDARDADIVSKGASRELAKLVRARLALDVSEDEAPAKLRAVAARYILAGEFRMSVSGRAPLTLDGVPMPVSQDQQALVLKLAQLMRKDYADEYAELADRVEGELGLQTAELSAEALGSIDTFRFEERVLLRHVNGLIAGHLFTEALTIASGHEDCFWLSLDLDRKAQWELSRRMAELGLLSAEIGVELGKGSADPATWVELYTATDGWHRLDRAQRRLESWTANLDEEPDEQAIGVVRRAYEDACQTTARGFSGILEKAGWNMRGLHQTEVFGEVVKARPRPVAYFLVDALRYEMGVELAERLEKTAEVSVRPAIAALPTVTPVGMAALQPGASGSFSVIEQGGKLGALIGGTFLPDLARRKKHTQAQLPKCVDLALDDLLSLPPTKLAKKLDGALEVLVRSQEIDHAGEAGFTFQARHVMDTVIDNLARAIRKLAAAGVGHAVVTSDHGHLFFPMERDESMRTDAPGGETIELHRRCWIGRGGTTPRGCVRVTASELGYASDLEFAFPLGVGVFRGGGDLAFVHGGLSLQELVIPVLVVRSEPQGTKHRARAALVVDAVPPAVTNRIFTVVVRLGGADVSMFGGSMAVRPLLVSAGRQVGGVGMVVGAELDKTGCVALEPNRATTLAFRLSDESVESLRIIIQDPTTDAELYRSAGEIPVRLGV